MLRASRLHRLLAPLALLAGLLLALAPVAGRVLAAGGPQLLAGWSELCTAEGLQLAPSEARDADGAPLAPASLHGDADCPYCPLAASLALPATATATVPGLAPATPPARRASPRRRFRRLHGPGSRGPPLQA
ncbi:DUF2946 domain-containing protein [Pseudoxanthomonas sp. SGNA-20]|nr:MULTISPECIES: DUF2946 family protein [unclassified Pseudoxanthomonas]RRN59116.1 DUF2946 domain-containing protein [Pseudoxanthomonas sp. SGNA-20]RRN81118.1 DUF2946 domain-containing protein [Pseudoxanthomonas sp. SGD-10]